MKSWKITVDHDLQENNQYHHPYMVHYNKGSIFNDWAFCKSFKTLIEAQNFIEERRNKVVDEYGRLVIYYDH